MSAASCTRLFSTVPGFEAIGINSAVVVPGMLGILSLFILQKLIKYRVAIRKRVKQVQKESWIFGMGLKMKRVKPSDDDDSSSSNKLMRRSENPHFLELNRDFVRQQQEQRGLSLLSLSDYMSSLQPEMLPSNVTMDDMPNLIQNELEAGLATALLKALGPNLGRAFLPAVGLGAIRSNAQGVASMVATSSWLFSKRNDDDDESNSQDKGNLPLSLSAVQAFSDTNAQIEASKKRSSTSLSSPPKSELSAIQKMKQGEVAADPSFAPSEPKDGEDDKSQASATTDDLVPSPFVVSRDFDNAVRQMENLIKEEATECGQCTREQVLAREELMGSDDEDEVPNKANTAYNPEGRKMADPTPINPRLFPGLHLGWGDSTKCSHTNREVIQNRLVSVLLNRLGANYHTLTQRGNENAPDDEELFRVQMNGDSEPITTPWEFVQALIDSGHHVTCVPTSRITTFGISLSVQESDSSWSDIPLACILESGYEDRKGNMAPALMPHSGLVMEIEGPLLGKRTDGSLNQCSIQHFIAIDGFCGWHSNHDADMPWLADVNCDTPVTGKEAVRAARLAGLYASVLNGLGTDMDLPFGGYGLTGVCNDSAALLEHCMYGKSNIYPMTSIGRFLMHSLRYTRDFRTRLTLHPGNEEELEDLGAILKSMREIPSDVHAAPANARSAAERMLYFLPKDPPFKILDETKRIMGGILQEEQDEALFQAKKAVPR